jgi:hypothetical protein
MSGTRITGDVGAFAILIPATVQVKKNPGSAGIPTRHFSFFTPHFFIPPFFISSFLTIA